MQAYIPFLIFGAIWLATEWLLRRVKKRNKKLRVVAAIPIIAGLLLAFGWMYHLGSIIAILPLVIAIRVAAWLVRHI